MSYCRWSTDDFGCDLYCYESAQGFVTHVAANRVVGNVPHVDFAGLLDGAVTPEGYMRQYNARDAFLATCERIQIGGPCDGETFVDPDLESFRARLLTLREGGYRFPDHVLQAVNEDIDESSPSSHPPADGFNGEDNDAN